MHRLALLAGALVVPVLPLLAAAPASAVDNVICVTPATGSCDQTVATIQLAINAANVNGVNYTIRLGATTYTGGPYQIDGTAHPLTLEGAGQGTTFIAVPAGGPQAYLSAAHATVRNLTITMTGTTSTLDIGLVLSSGATADHVTVEGTATSGAWAIQAGNSTVTHSVAQTPPSTTNGGRGIFSNGGNTISDTVISGTQALNLSDPNTTDTVSRVQIRSDYNAVVTDGGTINIDDALIDLGTSPGATGLAAANFNDSTNISPVAINANHVTIFGGGAGSRGAWAYAAALGAKQTTTLTMTNSIVRGPTTSLVADAINNGAPLGPSSAILNVSYSDFQNTGGTIDTVGGTGAGGVIQGAGNLNVDPGFVSASDHHLTAASPVVDKGNPAAGGPTSDLDGVARVQDGDENGTAVRDMGAYERPGKAVPAPDTTAPNTTITKKPAKRFTKAKAKFVFSATEAGATFECQLDGKAWKACPAKYTVKIKLGKHKLLVRAKDAAGNVDPTPASSGKFKRVKKN